MTKEKQNLKSLIRQSHQRQFNGEDYQFVAISLAESNSILFESDDYSALQSAPDPVCDCGFCATAPWE